VFEGVTCGGMKGLKEKTGKAPPKIEKTENKMWKDLGPRKKRSTAPIDTDRKKAAQQGRGEKAVRIMGKTGKRP